MKLLDCLDKYWHQPRILHHHVALAALLVFAVKRQASQSLPTLSLEGARGILVFVKERPGAWHPGPHLPRKALRGGAGGKFHPLPGWCRYSSCSAWMLPFIPNAALVIHTQ